MANPIGSRSRPITAEKQNPPAPGNFISSLNLLLLSLPDRFCLSWLRHLGPQRTQNMVFQSDSTRDTGVSRQSPATYTQPTQPWKRHRFGCNLLNPLVDLEGFEPRNVQKSKSNGCRRPGM